MKTSFKRWFLGALAGILAGVLFLAACFFSFKATNRLIDHFDPAVKREKPDYSRLKNNFFIGFENEAEIKFFDSHETSRQGSSEFATEGKRSLKVEHPSGRAYPGFVLDVYGKNCFDWSDMEEFSFDVYNPLGIPARLTIVIKSGPQYPKATFEVGQEIPAETTGRVKIKRGELAGLDLKQISCINIFMQDPRTTFIMYYDNFKVIKRKDSQ